MYSHIGTAAQKDAMTRVLRAYYAAASSEDGRTACALMYSILAEEIPENYGASPPGPPSLHGTTCAAVMTKVFRSRHDEFVKDSRVLIVTLVRVREHKGLALLRLGRGPERDITMHLERGRWRVDALFDSAMT